MKKAIRSKLALNPETIRTLDLQVVVGGNVPTSKQPGCDGTLSARCPK